MTAETNAERLKDIIERVKWAELYESEDSHKALADTLYSMWEDGGFKWLIQQAEAAERLLKVEDANYRFYNNGFEEERWALQEENTRLREALQSACNSLGADVEDYLPEGELE